eukprot:3938401-Rhodomonas_salina.1
MGRITRPRILIQSSPKQRFKRISKCPNGRGATEYCRGEPQEEQEGGEQRLRGPSYHELRAERTRQSNEHGGG